MPDVSLSPESLSLSARAEAVLYAHGGTMTVKALAEALECDNANLLRALDELSQALKGRGLALLRTERDASLRTAPEAAPLLEKINRERFSKDIGPAGLEVLAILLYRGPSSRSMIDYIRGVNSAATLRLLSARGLVEGLREKGETTYTVATDALAHLGIHSAEELPEYGTLKNAITTYESHGTGDQTGTNTGGAEDSDTATTADSSAVA